MDFSIISASFQNLFVVIVTLDYLINEQDGIGEQGGKFSKILKRAGWNKRAEGAKKLLQ